MIPGPQLQWELNALYARYASVLDDGPLAEWPSLFTDVCSYQIVPRDNFEQGLPLAIMRCDSRGMLADRVRAIQETVMFEPRYLRHLITNIHASPGEADALAVTANYLVSEVLADELPKILSVGRYLDTLVRNDADQLVFRSKKVVYDSVLVPNTIVYPL